MFVLEPSIIKSITCMVSTINTVGILYMWTISLTIRSLKCTEHMVDVFFFKTHRQIRTTHHSKIDSESNFYITDFHYLPLSFGEKNALFYRTVIWKPFSFTLISTNLYCVCLSWYVPKGNNLQSLDKKELTFFSKLPIIKSVYSSFTVCSCLPRPWLCTGYNVCVLYNIICRGLWVWV